MQNSLSSENFLILNKRSGENEVLYEESLKLKINNNILKEENRKLKTQVLIADKEVEK